MLRRRSLDAFIFFFKNLFMAFKRVPSPMVVTLGQQYNTGEKSSVMLYTYINRHAGTPDKNKNETIVVHDN